MTVKGLTLVYIIINLHLFLSKIANNKNLATQMMSPDDINIHVGGE